MTSNFRGDLDRHATNELRPVANSQVENMRIYLRNMIIIILALLTNFSFIFVRHILNV